MLLEYVLISCILISLYPLILSHPPSPRSTLAPSSGGGGVVRSWGRRRKALRYEGKNNWSEGEDEVLIRSDQWEWVASGSRDSRRPGGSSDVWALRLITLITSGHFWHFAVTFKTLLYLQTQSDVSETLIEYFHILRGANVTFGAEDLQWRSGWTRRCDVAED